MIQNIRLVMFDMSGTTIKNYNEVLECFMQASQATGINPSPKQINTMMGWSKIDVFRQLWTWQLKDGDVEEINNKSQKSFLLFKDLLEDWYTTHDIEPSEGTIETFKWLRELNIKIALGTGFYRKVADIILKKLGWLTGLDENYINVGNSPIDFSITSDQVVAGRPAPDMINRAMHVFGMDNTKEVVKIGDTPSDLEEGFNAGCFRSFGVTNGTHSHEELSQYPNDGLVPSIIEFKKLLLA
jgi:phosphonatase-like hydrolase